MPLPVPVGAATTALSTAVPAITSAGSSLLPQLFNALAMNSMLKAMPNPTGVDIFRTFPPDIPDKEIKWLLQDYTHPNDTYGLDYSDRMQKILEGASIVNDTFSPQTKEKLKLMAQARFPLSHGYRSPDPINGNSDPDWINGNPDWYSEINPLDQRMWTYTDHFVNPTYESGGLIDVGEERRYHFPDSFDDEMINNLQQADAEYESVIDRALYGGWRRSPESTVTPEDSTHRNTALGRWYAQRRLGNKRSIGLLKNTDSELPF